MGFRDTMDDAEENTIMENQMEKKVENDMLGGFISGLRSLIANILLRSSS